MYCRQIIMPTILLLASICPVTQAKVRVVMPDDPSGQEVRDVATAILSKIGDGDGAGAKELFAGEADQAQLLDAYVDWVKSFDALSKRVGDKFGEGEVAKVVPPVAGMIHRSADHQKQKILFMNDDAATIASEGVSFDEGMELHRIDGKWKVTHLQCDQRTGGLKEVVEALASVAKAVDAAVQGGKVASSKEAVALFDLKGKKVQELMTHRGLLPFRVLPVTPLKKWNTPDADAFGEFWGEGLLSPSISNLLASMPGIPYAYMTKERSIITDEEAGMSLLLGPKTGLYSVTFMGEGSEGCRQYSGKLPNGLHFLEKRKDVEKRLGRPFESTGGQFTPYSAIYPQLGLIVYYVKSAPMDPENPVAKVQISKPEENFKIDPAKLKYPRVAFRLVAADPAIAADELADPTDPTGKTILRVSRNVLLDEKSIAGVHLTQARAGSAELAMAIEMTDEGARKLKEISSANVGHKLAIVLDGHVLFAPNIHSEVGKNILFTMGENANNKETSVLQGRMHSAVFALPDSPEEGH